MPEQHQPWHGTASSTGDTPAPQRADDNASEPVRAEPLLRHAPDTSIRFSLEQMRQRAEPSRLTPPEQP